MDARGRLLTFPRARSQPSTSAASRATVPALGAACFEGQTPLLHVGRSEITQRDLKTLSQQVGGATADDITGRERGGQGERELGSSRKTMRCTSLLHVSEFHQRNRRTGNPPHTFIILLLSDAEGCKAAQVSFLEL